MTARSRAVLTRPKNPDGLFYRPGIEQVQRLAELLDIPLVSNKKKHSGINLILGCSQGSFLKEIKGQEKPVPSILFAFSHSGFIDRSKDSFSLSKKKPYPSASKVICQTQAQKDSILKDLPELDNVFVEPLIIPRDLKSETSEAEKGMTLKALGLSKSKPTYLLIGDYSAKDEIKVALDLARIMPFAQFIFIGTDPKAKRSVNKLDERNALPNLRFLQELRVEFIPSISWDISGVVVLDNLLCFPFFLQDCIWSEIPVISVHLDLLQGLLDPEIDYIRVELSPLSIYNAIKESKFQEILESSKKHLEELKKEFDPKAVLKLNP